MASLPGSSPEDPDDPCAKCGAPASWADEWTEDLTYRESMRYHFNRYLASPRMWPIGYLIGSPYSPLSIEQQIPERNWRDAFEDLLALESGGQMIDPESRERETIVSNRLWYARLTHSVSAFNQQLKRDEKYMSLLKRMREVFAREKLIDSVHSVDEQISGQIEKSQRSVIAGENLISRLKNEESKGWPASTYKQNGQWIASLISSGAIVGWESDLWDSAHGDYLNFQKMEAGKDGDYDGLAVTEWELLNHSKYDIPMQYGAPPWSTSNLTYPQTLSLPSPEPEQDVINEDDNTEPEAPPPIYSVKPASIMPMSILAQTLRAERIQLRSGKVSVKVFLQNFHTNGKMVEKEIIDDASKVLEEGDKARSSMIAMYYAVGFASQEQLYTREEEQFKQFKEDLD